MIQGEIQIPRTLLNMIIIRRKWVCVGIVDWSDSGYRWVENVYDLFNNRSLINNDRVSKQWRCCCLASLSMYRRKKWDPINYLPWTPINNTDCLRMKLGGSLKCSCPFPSHNVQTELKWWCSGHFWLRNARNQKSVFVVSFVEVCSCVIHEVLFVLENFPLAPPDHSSAYLHWIVHLKDSHWFNSHLFSFLLVETNCSGNPTITVHDWTLPQLSNFHACK